MLTIYNTHYIAIIYYVEFMRMVYVTDLQGVN